MKQKQILSAVVITLATLLLLVAPGSAAARGPLVIDGGGQRAIEQALKQARPGDTIRVKAGTYDNGNPLEPLFIRVAGEANAPITLVGQGQPRLETVLIYRSRHFRLEGFEIAHQQSPRFFVGIEVRHSEAITLRRLKIHHLSASAIGASGEGENLLIEQSEFYELVPPRSGQDAHCFVNSSVRNVTFRDNNCFGFIGDGYHAYVTGATERLDRGRTLIEGNRITNTKGVCSENAVDIKGEQEGEIILRDNDFAGFREMQAGQCRVHATGCGYCQVLTFHQGSTGRLLIENNRFRDSDNGLRNDGMRASVRYNSFKDIHHFVVYDRSRDSVYARNQFERVAELSHPKSNY